MHELLRMAKVWAIVEVAYTETNAWVMAVLAKVVGIAVDLLIK